MAWFVVMSKSIGPREAIRGKEQQNLSWMTTYQAIWVLLFD